MSEKKDLVAAPTTDLTEQDMLKIEQFKEEGLPGLASLEESVAYRAFDMYLSGSTYRQIQASLNLPRPLLAYLSHTYGWYAAKREYINELQELMKNRVIDAKLLSQDFLLLLNQAWQKRIGKKLKKFLATDDDVHVDEIDLKEVGQLLKTIEMISDLTNEGKDSKGRTPAVGLNLGDGVTIERSGDNKVTITPKEKTLGDMLAKFANDRREKETKSNEPEETKEESYAKSERN